ncbi:MAG: response regulator [Desulfotalea sp.]
MKILIAEDELATRMTIQVTLEKIGYDVVSAKNGKESLAEFDRNNHPRIIILDWEMPEMGGLEVCKRIKEKNLEPSPYIIFLTGRDEKKDTLEGFEAGADDYITKPFSAAELQARVRVAERLVNSQDALANTVSQLVEALNQLSALQEDKNGLDIEE